MKIANYFILGEIFNLLERLELQGAIDFDAFDSDSVQDINRLATDAILPAYLYASELNRLTILSSLEYFTGIGNAPIEAMRASCQELTLSEPASWINFFITVGQSLHRGFQPALETEGFIEDNNPTSATMIFSFKSPS